MHAGKNWAHCWVGACAVIAVTACTDDEKAPEPYLGLAWPSHGFQVRSVGADILPGEDVEYCEVAELPGEPGQKYYVNAVELANAPSSHHLFLSAAAPGSRAEARLRGMKLGDRVPCFSAQTAFSEGGLESVYGIQQHYGRLNFPAGIGREFYGGQRLVFDYHYVNASHERLQARSAVNFHLTDASRVEHIARLFGFYNWTIDTPAGQSASFTAECRFKQDVSLAGITRHTHRWGKDFDVWFAGGERDGQHLWTSHHWEHEVDDVFAEPLAMKAGEGFRFRCEFQNTESYPLRFGPSARDEMCILFGLAWNAESSETVRAQSCDITWTDSEGIGRPASFGEGFPPPEPGERALCLAGSAPDGGTLDECAECRCNSCASGIIRCAADPDCYAILQCVQRTSCGNSCGSICQSVIDEHASAVGLITSVASCIDSKCPACSLQGEDDAG